MDYVNNLSNLHKEFSTHKIITYVFLAIACVTILIYAVLIGILWQKKENNGLLIIDGMKKNYITKQDVLEYDNIYLINFNTGDTLEIASDIGEKAYAKIFYNGDDLINTSFTGFFNIIRHGNSHIDTGTYDLAGPVNNTNSYRSEDVESKKNISLELSGAELSLYYDNSGTLTVYGLTFGLSNLIVT